MCMRSVPLGTASFRASSSSLDAIDRVLSAFSAQSSSPTLPDASSSSATSIDGHNIPQTLRTASALQEAPNIAGGEKRRRENGRETNCVPCRSIYSSYTRMSSVWWCMRVGSSCLIDMCLLMHMEEGGGSVLWLLSTQDPRGILQHDTDGAVRAEPLPPHMPCPSSLLHKCEPPSPPRRPRTTSVTASASYVATPRGPQGSRDILEGNRHHAEASV